EVIEIGGDGGGLDDLLGLTVIGRDAETGVWYWWSRAWAHKIALERRKSEAPRYMDFAKDGDLVLVDEIGIDVKEFGDIVRRCDASGLLDRIGVDPSGIGAIVDELENGDENGEGKIDHDRIVGISQGWRLNSAIKTTERKVAAREIIHADQKLMAWCVGNARVEPKGNAILITKQASGTGKIDPLMAGFSAVALMAMNPEAKNKRVPEAYNAMAF
ncbi:MAG: terminase large subunit, partial [Syntrophales bacterium]|nr:terminase large subunit [Syntrophales bacterium]